MVRSVRNLTLGALVGFAHLASAGIAVRAPWPAVTPPPISPFDPRSPYYGILPRDDKLITADGTSTCGFVGGNIASALTCGDKNTCSASVDGGSTWGGCCGGDDCSVMTACSEVGGKRDDNDDDDDDQALSCSGKNGKCVTYNIAGINSYTCSNKAASIKGDTVAKPSTTSTTSSSSSSSSTSTTASTTTSASSTPTPSSVPTNAGLAGYAIAGIVIGSVLGAAAIGMILYHFIRNKISPDDHTDEVPLIENNPAAYKGPWQGREG